VEQLREHARDDNRIVIIDRSLDYGSVLSLYASLDVFVSLHRSEGIGLGLMEAMALGTPVLATGWSGNMSFMDRSSACMVAYELVPVRSDTPVYRRELLGPTARWAEPDLSSAAEWMRILANRPDIRRSFGRNAAAAMSRYQDEARRGSFVEELRVIRQSEVTWGVGAERRRARRRRLERNSTDPHSLPAPPFPLWLRQLKSLAKRACLR
jgi:glycosyltransferase involved in cell wall biosynthesis